MNHVGNKNQNHATGKVIGDVTPHYIFALGIIVHAFDLQLPEIG